MRHLVIVGFLVFVTGCAGSGASGISRSYEFAPNTKKGIVFLSTSFENKSQSGCGPAFSHLTLVRKGGNLLTGKSVILQNPLVGPYFKDPDGYFIIFELPENEYVFKRLLYGDYYVTPLPVDIRFRVSAGEVHYLGHVNVTILTCHTNKISLADRRDRDVPAFAQEMKNFGPESVKYQILKIGPAIPG